MRSATIADPGVSQATAATAAAVTALLLVSCAAAIGLRNVQLPVIPPFIPICGTLWCAGDLLTAFLLFAHFRVTGRIAFIVLACAYLATGLLSTGYLAAFPRVFFPPGALPQVSLWLWLAWHAAFPVAVGAYFFIDPSLQDRLIDERVVRRSGWWWFALTALAALGVTAVVWMLNDRLPHVLDASGFAPLFRFVAAPVVATLALSAAACVWFRASRRSALHVWLAVALIVMVLDALLNAVSTERYALAWYVGKFETLVMATLLLLVLLQEIATMYEETASFAMHDALTGLRNRRNFDDAAPWLLALSARRDWPVAALMIDIDYFKRLNDERGHAEGDRCLRRVGAIIRHELARGSDLVARYGGEEFAALLVDVTADGVRAIAERLRAACAQPGVEDAPLVTVSIGIAWEPGGTGKGVQELLATADGALYEAKRGGRNQCSFAAL